MNAETQIIYGLLGAGVLFLAQYCLASVWAWHNRRQKQ